MQLSYTTKDGKITVIVEGKTQTELFEQLAEFQEVFENRTCRRDGKSSDDVRFVVREVDGNKFYELVCVDDSQPSLKWAKLAFGQHKKGGTLFPKRKDENDNWLPNNGWCRYNKETGKNE